MQGGRISTPRLVSLIALLSACSGSEGTGNGANGDAAEALTKNLSFGSGVTVTPFDGSQPDGTDTSGVTVEPLPGSTGPLTIEPGDPVSFMIPWSGGPISKVNIGFGGSKYFQVVVPQGAPPPTSGIANVPAVVGPNVCSDLASTCHQIKCYEQVVLPDGVTVSKAAAQQILLDCTGGAGCIPDAGTGGSGGTGGAGGTGGSGGKNWQCNPPSAGDCDCLLHDGPASGPACETWCCAVESTVCYCWSDTYSSSYSSCQELVDSVSPGASIVPACPP